MLYRYLLLAFIFISQISNAQNSEDIKFIRAVLNKKHVLYSENISSNLLKKVGRALDRDTLCERDLVGRQIPSPSNPMVVLTVDERVFINKEIDKMKDLSWNDNILKRSIAVVDKGAKQYQGKYDKSDHDLKDFDGKVYSFTKPIFIRNNMICLFYYGVWCGDECGHGGLFIYKKTNNKWKVFSRLFYWIS